MRRRLCSFLSISLLPISLIFLAGAPLILAGENNHQHRAAMQDGTENTFALPLPVTQAEKTAQEQVFRKYLQEAELGNAKAQREVAAMLENGEGVTQDFAAAASWYAKAAAQGFARAQTSLGILYEEGRGVPQDYQIALSWYRAAAAQGHGRGQVQLGLLHEKGLGVPQDYNAAGELYRKAALQGYTRGELHLGRVYEEGLGVEPDLQQARQWYEKAAGQGYPPAKEKLRALLARPGSREQPQPTSAPSSLAPRQTASPFAATSATTTPPTPAPPPQHQPDPRLEANHEAVQTIHSLARRTLAQSKKEAALAPAESFLESLMRMECSDLHLNHMEREVLEAKAMDAGDDYGVFFESGLRVQQRGLDRTWSEDDDISSSRKYGYVGLSWDLLRSGLRENKSQSRQLDYQRQILELRDQQVRPEELFSCHDTYLIHYFNKLKRNIQKQREDVLAHYQALLRDAYFQGEILADDLYKAEYDLTKCRRILAKYEAQGSLPLAEEEAGRHGLPEVVELRLPALKEAVESDQVYERITDLEKAILEEKYDALNDKRLRLYAHQGVIHDSGSASSDDLTLGLYFSFPLWRPEERSFTSEISRKTGALKRERETVLQEITRLHNAYGEKLTDAVQMQYRERITAERLRRALVSADENRQGSDFYHFTDHLLITQVLEEMLDVQFEFVAVQESLYRQLLHIFTLAKTGFRSQFIAPAALAAEETRGRSGSRAVYIWSESMERHANEFLLNAFAAKSISRAIISPGRNMNRDKLADFVKKAGKQGVGLELLLGENSWIKPEKWLRAEERVKEIMDLKLPVHLDIEPHVLPDFKTNKDTYHAWFLELVGKIRDLTRGKVELAISLPVHGDAAFLAAASRLADRVYVMAYERPDPEKLLRALAPFRDLPKEKVVIALRPKDFPTEAAMEMVIDRLAADFGGTSFAFHELEQYFQLTGRKGP